MRAIIPTLESYVQGDSSTAEVFDELKPAMVIAETLDSDAGSSSTYQSDLIAAVSLCRIGFKRMLDFMRDEYTPAIRTDESTIGCSSLPCGLAG